ncbi:MAG: 2-dehydro-3-deoxygalactonokinase [Burkholderiaceae bacterium]
MNPSERMEAPALIGLDWGTSSLRAYAVDSGGRVLASRRSEHGIMHLPEAPAGSGPNASTQNAARFESALQTLCGDWLQAHPQAALLACGMVGSAQGWREAAYHPTPCAIDQLAQALTPVVRPGGHILHIVPGLIRQGEIPNVMRGEETQIAGVLQGLEATGGDVSSLLIGLPGTHSKWAWVDGGRVTRFETFMTGEVFAVLRHHTILGRTMGDGPPSDASAFERAIRLARPRAGAMGLLADIFSTRTLALTGQLRAEDQPEHLSGLLIGHEVAALLPHLSTPKNRLVLCGETDLCQRYATALALHDHPVSAIQSGVVAAGLWRIAQAAALV